MPSVAKSRHRQALAGLERAADEGRRDTHFRRNFAHGKAALVQFGEPVVVKDQPSPAADAPQFTGFVEACSDTLADASVLLFGDPCASIRIGLLARGSHWLWVAESCRLYFYQ
jgi:hypothetical protein